MNYIGLKDAAKKWADRHDTEVDDIMDTMIIFVETMIDRHIKIGRGAKRALLNPVVKEEQGYYSLPSDFNSARVVRIDGCPIEYKTPEQVLVTDGMYYSILANQLYITGVVDENIIELVYIQKVDHLTEKNPTNWMSNEYPDIYMTGMMYWLERFVKNYDVAEGWMDRMMIIINEIEYADSEDRWSGHTLQRRPTS